MPLLRTVQSRLFSLVLRLKISIHGNKPEDGEGKEEKEMEKEEEEVTEEVEGGDLLSSPV